MMLRLALAVLIVLPASACATGGQDAAKEVKAVVLDEEARQAAAETAERTGDAETALEAGKAAADSPPR